MECNKVIPLVLDNNRSLFLILTRFLYVLSEGNGYENNVVAMVTYKSFTKFLAFHREKPIHSYLSK